MAQTELGVLASTPLLNALPTTLKLTSVRTNEVVDYTALAQRISAKQTELAALMGKPGRRIVIGVHDPISCLVTLFAVWAGKCCAVLVNPNLSKDEQDRVCEKVAATGWVSDDSVASCDMLGADKTDMPDAALILMTSGTTGVPKGVTHSLATLQARLIENVKEIGTNTLAQTLCPLPLFFGHGLIGNCLTALYAGQTVHFWPTPQLQEYQQFGAEVTKRKITFLSSVPSMWRMILQLSDPPVKTLQRVHVGSAPLSGMLWDKIIAWSGTSQVFNTFGMTETANWISGGQRPDDHSAEGHVGAPWGGVFRVFRDGNLHETGRGEIAVSSPSLMLGLWDAPDQTAALMKDGFMLTGDIGDLSDDQTLCLVGRNKHEINRAGIKVLAEEIDMLLERHPAIHEACGFGIPDEIAGELVAAVVKLQPDAQITQAGLIAWCQTQARPEAVPFRIEIVQDIPKNDRGKIARADVRRAMEAKWS